MTSLLSEEIISSSPGKYVQAILYLRGSRHRAEVESKTKKKHCENCLDTKQMFDEHIRPAVFCLSTLVSFEKKNTENCSHAQVRPGVFFLRRLGVAQKNTSFVFFLTGNSQSLWGPAYPAKPRPGRGRRVFPGLLAWGEDFRLWVQGLLDPRLQDGGLDFLLCRGWRRRVGESKRRFQAIDSDHLLLGPDLDLEKLLPLLQHPEWAVVRPSEGSSSCSMSNEDENCAL